jgi:lipoprotein-anchoring transpeptidase ErfK/SrfK
VLPAIGRIPRRPRRAVAAKGAALGLLVSLFTVGSGAASASGGSTAATPTKSFPYRYTLTNAKVGHWAPVLRNVTARREPTTSSPVVTRIAAITRDWTQNLVLVIGGIDLDPRETWYKVRLSILPNNSTGWVPRNALGNLYAVHTHLYVNRATFTATLKRDGRVIFTTRVGVGRSRWPTPAGQFYVRDKVTDFNDPFYGPIAFGTSARSAVLTDWPGGGVIGIHGTNAPEILPGAVSHGCIRIVNKAIIRLSRLMQVGTPLTIT